VSVTWYDSVAIAVEVAFTTDPLAVTPTWTDISAYVLEIPNITSGRSSEFTQISPSTMSVVLSNGDRRFDPEHAAGPYFGTLLPGRKIRVKVVYSAVTYYLFTGYVMGWPQEYQSSVDSTVTVNCVDGSKFLEQATLERSAYEAAVLADSPIHYWPLQEQNTTTSSDYEDVVAGLNMRAALPDMQSAELAAPVSIANAVTSNDPLNYIFNAGLISAQPLAVSAWFQFGELAAAGVESPQVYVCSARGNDASFQLSMNLNGDFKAQYYNPTSGKTASAIIPQPEGLHHIHAYADASNVYLYVDAVLAKTEALAVATTSTVFPGAYVGTFTYADLPNYISHVAVWATAPSTARIQVHYLAGVTAFGHPYGERSGDRIDRVLDEVGWPAADRVLSTGDTVHGPYLPARQSAMKYLRDVEAAEDGYVFLDGQGRLVLRDRNWQWTQTVSVAFSDTPSGAELDYVDVVIDANSADAIRTSVSASYGADGYLFSEDAAARAAYGPEREALSVPTIDSPVTARGLTAYKLRTMKDPQTRIVELVHTPRILNATAWPKILGLQVGARITVERHPQAVGSAIVKTLIVQGIEHRIDSVWWETTLYLSPAIDSATDAPYLIVGDATYGKIGAVAGNQIPF
jgi:hypothetical protein